MILPIFVRLSLRLAVVVKAVKVLEQNMKPLVLMGLALFSNGPIGFFRRQPIRKFVGTAIMSPRAAMQGVIFASLERKRKRRSKLRLRKVEQVKTRGFYKKEVSFANGFKRYLCLEPNKLPQSNQLFCEVASFSKSSLGRRLFFAGVYQRKRDKSFDKKPSLELRSSKRMGFLRLVLGFNGIKMLQNLIVFCCVFPRVVI